MVVVGMMNLREGMQARVWKEMKETQRQLHS